MRNRVVVTLYSILLLAITLAYSIIHAQIHVTIMQMITLRTLNYILKTSNKRDKNLQYITTSYRITFETNNNNLVRKSSRSNTYAKDNHNKYFSTRQIHVDKKKTYDLTAHILYTHTRTHAIIVILIQTHKYARKHTRRDIAAQHMNTYKCRKTHAFIYVIKSRHSKYTYVA